MTRIVQPSGNRNARFCIIGEAPGKVEAMRGIPFVGPAGNLLTGLLAQAGIARTDCYMTNVVKVMPETKIDEFISYNTNKHCIITSKAYEDWERRLHDELREVTPTITIPLGNVALYAICRKWGIRKYRHSQMFSPFIPGLVLPTIHPSSIFKDPPAEQLAQLDLKEAYALAKLIQETGNTHAGLPVRNLIIEPSYEQTIDFLERAFKVNRVGFDIETIRTRQEGDFTDYEISCLAVSTSATECICVPFINKNRTSYFSSEQECNIWNLLTRILSSPYVEKIIQNALFDVPFMLRKHAIVVRNVHDTMIAQATITPDFHRGLDFLCSIHTREPYYKDEGKQYNDIRDEHSFWLYNAKDAAVLHEILEKQFVDLDMLGNRDTYEAKRQLIPILTMMNYQGLRVDKEGIEAAKIENARQLRELQKQLLEMSDGHLKPTATQKGYTPSTRVIAKYFYEHLKQRPYTKNGAITTDVVAMQKLARRGFKEASIILAMRRLEKISTTYLETILDEDGRIRSSLNCATDTGRLSSGKTIFNTGMNIENLPREGSVFKVYIHTD